ncbi:hypothetical protein K7X08_030509 [Anisodus acutangulus]|uniref:Uncharacterized protein n=1 Tax=Anisodus acutangulus TaxID=402998 RepID=A0A9Q1RPC5_9SOLA|nr:hypothetical protein K7X08_030509 [Anisodus acutangulus]
MYPPLHSEVLHTMEGVEMEHPLPQNSSDDFCNTVLSQFCESNNVHHIHICTAIANCEPSETVLMLFNSMQTKHSRKKKPFKKVAKKRSQPKPQNERDKKGLELQFTSHNAILKILNKLTEWLSFC